METTDYSGGNTYESIPGKEQSREISRPARTEPKKKAKIERKIASKFTTTLPPKEIIKINRDGTPKSGIKLAAMGRCVQDHTRPHSSFQRTHTKTGKKKPNTSRTDAKLHHGRSKKKRT